MSKNSYITRSVRHPNPTSSPYTLSSPGMRPATAGPTHTHTHSRTLHGRSVHITNSMSHPNPNEFTLHVMFHRCPASHRRTLYMHTQTLTNWKSVHDDNSLFHRTPDKLTLHVMFHRCVASHSRALLHTHTHMNSTWGIRLSWYHALYESSKSHQLAIYFSRCAASHSRALARPEKG